MRRDEEALQHAALLQGPEGTLTLRGLPILLGQLLDVRCPQLQQRGQQLVSLARWNPNCCDHGCKATDLAPVILRLDNLPSSDWLNNWKRAQATGCVERSRPIHDPTAEAKCARGNLWTPDVGRKEASPGGLGAQIALKSWGPRGCRRSKGQGGGGGLQGGGGLLGAGGLRRARAGRQEISGWPALYNNYITTYITTI